MKHTIRYYAKCNKCDGTGLYVGMGERDGAAVECWECKGIGARLVTIEYEDAPLGRIARTDIRQVHRGNPGICINADPKYGGMPYEDWLAEKPFPPKSENRCSTCPHWWYQGMEESQGIWWWCPTLAGSMFSECAKFDNKSECWREWDERMLGHKD